MFTTRNATATIVGIAFGACITGGIAVASSASQLPPRTHWMSTSCNQEDDYNCAWNARTQGNGQGHSFYEHTVRLRSANGAHIIGKVDCHSFVGTRFARAHDECQLRRPVAVNRRTDLLSTGIIVGRVHCVWPTGQGEPSGCDWIR